MMEYGEALTTIERGEVTTANAAEVLKAVKARNDLVLNEKRKVVSERDEIKSELDYLLQESGATGADLTSQIKDLKGKLANYKQELEQSKSTIAQIESAKAALESEKATLLQEKQGFERSQYLDKLASKIGANPVVLGQLTQDLALEKLKLEGDSVTIDGKPVTEWVEGDETRKAFLPALFPGEQPARSQPQIKPTPKLPSGAPASAPEPQGTQDILAKVTGRNPNNVGWIGKRS